MLKTFVLMACLAFSAAVLAQAAPAAGDEDGLQMIVKQQKALKADLDDGGIEGLTPRQNTIVRKAQAEVFAVSEGKSRLDDLSMEEKIRLENALERINAEIVNTRAASNNQNVCWRERVSGTTMKKTRCGTQAEMREAREGARDFLEKGRVCVPPGCGGG
jgi:beta-lactam-binding protein with PASTA domain